MGGVESTRYSRDKGPQENAAKESMRQHRNFLFDADGAAAPSIPLACRWIATGRLSGLNGARWARGDDLRLSET